MAQVPDPSKTVGDAECATETPRKFGTLKDRITIVDPDWWKPMFDEEVEAFLEERY